MEPSAAFFPPEFIVKAASVCYLVRRVSMSVEALMPVRRNEGKTMRRAKFASPARVGGCFESFCARQ